MNDSQVQAFYEQCAKRFLAWVAGTNPEKETHRCSECNGRGYWVIGRFSNYCKLCNGRGYHIDKFPTDYLHSSDAMLDEVWEAVKEKERDWEILVGIYENTGTWCAYCIIDGSLGSPIADVDVPLGQMHIVEAVNLATFQALYSALGEQWRKTL